MSLKELANILMDEAKQLSTNHYEHKDQVDLVDMYCSSCEVGL